MAKTRLTTIGQLRLRQILPEETHYILDEGPITKRTIYKVLQEVADKHPKKYKKVVHDLHQLGEEVAYHYGGVSSLTSESFLPSPEATELREEAKQEINRILADNRLTDESKRDRIAKTLQEYKMAAQDLILKTKEGTSFPLQIKSGARGSSDSLLKMLTGSFSAVGGEGQPIETPILHGFAEGLTPAEYWTSQYGTRLGYYGTKFATPVAGDIANQLLLAAHKLRVTEKDCGTGNGLLVDPGDEDYEGAALVQDTGGVKAGTVLTPKIMRKLSQKKDRVVVRSPITCQAEEGICQKCAGKIPDEFPELGSFPGIIATAAITEPLSQSNISSKHTQSKAISGLDLIKALVTVPSSFTGEAPVAKKTGIVKEIEKTDLGPVVNISGIKYQLSPDQEPIIRVGQEVERGEPLSTGVPNPKKIAQYRGVGEGRRQFAKIFSKALYDSNINHNKRNVDFIARALVNHAKMEEPFEGYIPGDIVNYSYISRHWTPRETAEEKSPKLAIGQYLESPVGHYTIGTRLTKKMVKDIRDMGVDSVLVNKTPLPFKPTMRRGYESMAHSEDWLDRMAGYYAKGSLMEGLFSGNVLSDPNRKTAVIPQIVEEGRIRPV